MPEKAGNGLILLLLLAIGLLHCANASSETLSEELFIKPLPTGHVYSHFQFTIKWDVNPEETKRITKWILSFPLENNQ